MDKQQILQKVTRLCEILWEDDDMLSQDNLFRAQDLAEEIKENLKRL